MKFKNLNSDFIVKEIPSISHGRDFIYFLKKDNLNTTDIIHFLENRFHTRIGFAGNKDKKAITEQYISSNKKIDNIDTDYFNGHFSLNFVQNGAKLNLGDLKGNEFILNIELDENDLKNWKKIESNIKKGNTRFLNLFDDQRFGIDENNLNVGRALIKKDNIFLIKHFNLDEKRWLNDLEKIPIRELRFAIHAYQSHLWNKAAEELKDENVEEIPLIGFMTRITNEKLKEVYEKILNDEGITTRSFTVPYYKELANEGGTRKKYIEVNNIKYNIDKNILHIEFFLPKGCYATMFIKKLFE